MFLQVPFKVLASLLPFKIFLFSIIIDVDNCLKFHIFWHVGQNYMKLSI